MIETTSDLRQRDGWGTGAFDQLVRAHQPALLSRAMKLTGSRADAWDLVQDTFVRALSHAPQDAPAEGMRRWLFTVMGNLQTDRCRMLLRRRTLSLSDDQRLPPRNDEPDEAPIWQLVDQEQVARCVIELPPPFRDAFVLHELEGLSLADTARRLKVAVGTAGTRVYRARLRLRQLLLGSLGQEAAQGLGGSEMSPTPHCA